MSRTPSTFKFSDLSRALRAAREARVAVDVEITPGKMTVVTKQPGESRADRGDTLDGWMKKRGKDAHSA
jgi:hypothetical protein